MIVFPNAKINIGLFVTEKRPDGFHNLETVFYPIPLSDILEIEERDGKEGEYDFQTTGIDVVCEPEKNLVVKAYRLLSHDYKLPAIRIHLHKIIPFGAGLGGGSADAAFMLKALNKYFKLSLSVQQLLRYAGQLGSDCAFFIRNCPAFATGKGDLLEDMDLSLKDYRMVVIKPSVAVSTPEAYAGIRPIPASYDLRKLAECPVEEWKVYVNNDFEQGVFNKYPEIAALKQYFYGKGALYASMTGSGSAVYGIFEKSTEISSITGDNAFIFDL